MQYELHDYIFIISVRGEGARKTLPLNVIILFMHV